MGSRPALLGAEPGTQFCPSSGLSLDFAHLVHESGKLLRMRMASAVAGITVLVAVPVRTLTEHFLCAGVSSECSREFPSLNVLDAAQGQTL